jgi:hypothetical protein
VHGPRIRAIEAWHRLTRGLLASHPPPAATDRSYGVAPHPLASSDSRRVLVCPCDGPSVQIIQRELIIEGTREGLDAARARGRTGGRKPKLNARQAATVRRMYQAVGPDGKRQHTVAEIAEAVGVHRTTVYDYLKREG